MDIYAGISENINNIKNEISRKLNSSTSALLHNIISLNAHNIQEVHAVIPKDNIGLNYKEKIAEAKQFMRNNPHEFANAIYRISKNNMAMKMEFSVFNRLFGETPKLSVRKHDLKKVILSILHNFFQDFNEKKVLIEIEGDSFDVHFDYESMHVVFHHLLENAVKYCLEKRNIIITLCRLKNSITFDMYSIEITDKDIGRIYDEGYSGDYAQLAEKSGKGIGMSRVKKLLDINDAGIEIIRNENNDSPIVHKQVSYTKNKIVIYYRR
ncbi:hypothetical protein [Endozoicomonas sp. ALE010]|uniref:hypothetical protein n=1 Tax=Endozoicomonas sp. ALE010 TaxID=3403081 RepID=UPI003BB66210